METWIDSKTLYEGRVISLRVGHVRMDDGTVAFREVVEHPGGVAVVPVLGDSVILIRQYRVAIGQDILEIPAGKLEGAEEAAVRCKHGQGDTFIDFSDSPAVEFHARAMLVGRGKDRASLTRSVDVPHFHRGL